MLKSDPSHLTKEFIYFKKQFILNKDYNKKDIYLCYKFYTKEDLCITTKNIYVEKILIFIHDAHSHETKLKLIDKEKFEKTFYIIK